MISSKVKLTEKLAQEMQNEIFKEMTAEQKLTMGFNFFRLAKKLNPSYFRAEKRRRKIAAESHRYS